MARKSHGSGLNGPAHPNPAYRLLMTRPDRTGERVYRTGDKHQAEAAARREASHGNTVRYQEHRGGGLYETTRTYTPKGTR